MPIASPRPCSYPLCNKLTPCPDHGKRLFQDRQIPTYYKWYYRKSWLIIRANKLRRNPLCEECERNHIMTHANEVDHITPHKGDINKFFDEDNLQSLCEPCHSRKTMNESGLNKNKYNKQPININGWPIK